MTEDDCSKILMPTTDSSSNTKQKKRSKWDQPAESVVSAGITASYINPVTASFGHFPQVLTIQQHITALAQKIQPKIQEELIAREIVINDAESSVRYRLTKRQTQEEIQKCTGAIVITRGKYRPPNAPSDGEKPLYLHVSSGTHLETTADRIKAVDQAAAMVEEILKQGANGLKVVQPFSTCVFLGFEPDPSLNIIARIRGPNDQYVNHIMNETGSTVLLRGRGSGNLPTSNPEEQQPMHLYLSSSNPKSLEHAKLLAENLLDTICAECGASRVSSIKVYGAVPPPQQLVSENTAKSATLIANSTSSLPGVAFYPQSSLSQGTSYNGYGGIYPQVTPLQQVALALKQSTAPITSTVSATQKIGNPTTSLILEKEKRPHKRKFQELPVAAEGSMKTHQDFGILKPSEAKSLMPPPVKLVQPFSNGMMPPPSRMMPPPPPRFDSSTTLSVAKVVDVKTTSKPETKSVPETLISLMDYGDDEDDDIEESTEEEPVTMNSKPFWAV